MKRLLSVYTIYEIEGGGYTIKKWDINGGPPLLDPIYSFSHPDLVPCRTHLHQLGLFPLPPDPLDAPDIVETWI